MIAFMAHAVDAVDSPGAACDASIITEHIDTETERSAMVASAQSRHLGTAIVRQSGRFTDMRGCAGRDPVWGARHGEDAAG